MLYRPESPRTRRALKAILLTAVLAIAGNVALGMAVADDTAADADTPFALPAPHDGDRGRYTIRQGVWHDNGPLDEGPERELYRFFWNGTGEAYDQDGNHHHTSRLDYVRPSDWPHMPKTVDHDTYHFSQATGEAVAYEQNHAYRHVLPYAPTHQEYDIDMRFLSFSPGGSDFLPCGIRNTLQGASGGHVADPLFPSCRLPGSYRDLGLMEYTFVGSTEHDGHRYSWYHAQGNISDPQPAPPWETPTPLWPNVTVTFRDDIPYPVYIKVGPLKDGTERVVRLAGFERGTTPLGDRTSDVPPLPQVALAPRPDWTLDDTGVAHPYPLSTAYKEALDDPDTGLAAFMQKHPDAAVVEAEHQSGDTETGPYWRWHLRVADGKDSLWVCQERVDRGTGDLVPALARPLPTDPRECPEEGKEAPTLPDQTPRLADLEEVAKQIAQRQKTPFEMNGWEFRAVCIGPACQAEDLAFTLLDERQSGGPTILEPAESSVTLIEFGGDGRARGMLVSRTSEGSAPSGDHTPIDPSPLALDVTQVPTWRLPPAAQAAGVGVLAGLVGLLYWLWPALKQGVASALFSRIDRPKALHHEARARLLSVIEAEPGLHANEIVRRSGLSRAVVRHHLETLARTGLVHETRTGGRTTYVATGVDARLAEGLASVGSEGAVRLLAHVAAHPDATAASAARALGTSRQAVSKQVQRMASAGVLVAERQGRSVRLRLTVKGHAVRQVRRGRSPNLA